MESEVYQVSAFWDSEAAVWFATSEDVPGLATEADTIEALSHKLRDIVPDLLMSNHVISADYAGAIASYCKRRSQAGRVTKGFLAIAQFLFS